MKNFSHPALHRILAGWLEAFPYPTLIVGHAMEIIFINEPMKVLFGEQGLDTRYFDPSFLLTRTLFDYRYLNQVKEMEPGKFLRSPIDLESGGRSYTLEAVRLPIDGVDYFCGVLVPGSEIEPTDLVDMLDKLACFIIQFDTKGDIIYINKPLVHHLGYSRSDVPALRNLREIDTELNEQILEDYRKQTKAQGHAMRTSRFRKKDGSLLAVELSVLASDLSERESYLLTARDITLELSALDLHERELSAATDQANRLQVDNDRLQAALNGHPADRTLVYHSEKYAEVVDRIKQVAQTNTTVLITGETGTGKEVIARMIHRLSQCCDGPFVTVDCGAIPEQLIESQLFGYRKGAFTGATKDYKGRFATADGGTIFLDEIGEMPLDMQSRLLRVLQEKRFTPLGQNDSISTDFRIISATNRDLEQLVQEGRFRADLWYRLNVFPIHSLPLRERMEDLEVLIQHFIRKFNAKFEKQVLGVDAYTLERLRGYSFPGNIRELENMVERAFIVSNGKSLPITLPEDNSVDPPKPILDVFDGRLTEFLSLDDYQRKYIELVLESTDGKVSGADGAASILKLNPQTLFSKMKKLGIKR